MATMPNEYQKYISENSPNYGLDPALVAAFLQTESNWNPGAVSPAGAGGMAQFMPGTAAQYGYSPEDRMDPYKSMDMEMKHLADLSKKYQGDQTKMAAAYNAGQGAVDKYGGVPPYKETQAYVPKIDSAYAALAPLFGGGGGPAAQSAAPQAPAEEKKSGIGKYLAPLLQFALPTITGAVLGSRSPAMGGLGGALMGLTGGGLGYLNAQGQAEKRGIEKSKAEADARYKYLKLKIDAGTADAKEQREWAKLSQDASQFNASQGLKERGLELDKNKFEFDKTYKNKELDTRIDKDAKDKMDAKAKLLAGYQSYLTQTKQQPTVDGFKAYIKTVAATDKSVPVGPGGLYTPSEDPAGLGNSVDETWDENMIKDLMKQMGYDVSKGGNTFRVE